MRQQLYYISDDAHESLWSADSRRLLRTRDQSNSPPTSLLCVAARLGMFFDAHAFELEKMRLNCKLICARRAGLPTCTHVRSAAPCEARQRNAPMREQICFNSLRLCLAFVVTTASQPRAACCFPVPFVSLLCYLGSAEVIQHCTSYKPSFLASRADACGSGQTNSIWASCPLVRSV